MVEIDGIHPHAKATWLSAVFPVNLEGIYGGAIGTEYDNAFIGSKIMFGYNLPQYKVLI